MTEIEQELARLTAAQQKRVLSRLRKAYQQASATVWQKTRELMDAYAESGLQSKIYQARFQKALDSILDGTLDKLREDSYKTVSAYVEDCYEQGFLGALYDMQGQGVPLVFPVDPAQMYKAVTLDSRLSKPMYEKMGIDTATLKRAVREELSRGIASGLTYDEIASSLNRRMGTGQYNAWRIARTEGGRVQSEAAYHAQQKAKENGADVVKQWNACLDSRVRPDHALLHNQIRETDEPFEVNGHTAMHPHGFGVAKEDINCRCSLLTRARWAMSEEELAQLETDDDVTVEEIDAGSYQEFREKAGEAVESRKPVEPAFTDMQDKETTDSYFGAHKDPDARGANGISDPWTDSLAQAQWNAIQMYSSNNYTMINKALRTGEGFRKWAKTISDIDPALTSYDLKDNIVVHRYVRSLDGTGIDLRNCVGTVYTEKGYTSTSPATKDLKYSWGMDRPYRFEIEVTKGKGRGGYIKSISVYPWENEWLIPRDSSFDILEVRKEDRWTVIRMRLKN